MRAESTAVQVWGLDLTLPNAVSADGASPLEGGVVRRFRLRLSPAAVQRLLDPIGVRIRLVADGAAIEKQVGPVRVIADLRGSVSANGGLRLDATSVRAGGWLPVPPRLVAMALESASAAPGLRVVGSQALELDLAGVLEHILAPWGWSVPARITSARIRPDYLELECGSDEG